MTLSYEEITEYLTSAPGGFEARRIRDNGTVDIFRGRDFEAFLAKSDGRLHEHKVFDSSGNLVYHRDMNGRVLLGATEQIEKAIRKQKVGRGAVTAAGIFRESLRRAIAWNMRQLR